MAQDSKLRAFASLADNRKTALFDIHTSLGGKMVPFAGYQLPVQYKDSIINSHMHCRTSASLFDVSHMGQLKFQGSSAVAFLESVLPGDIEALKINQARLSLICNEKGGIIDDCIVTKKEDHLMVVVNGACKVGDMLHLQKHLDIFNQTNQTDVSMELLDDRSLIAFQGPKACEVLQGLVKVDLSDLEFMNVIHTKVGTIDNAWVSRCGYTGEDGFEISVKNEDAVELWNSLLEDERVLAAGLGARDSLRLEAGLCLYGHDLNEDISPVEGTLLWTISKRRRAQANFVGAEHILKQIKDGVEKKRVGLLIKSGAPARDGSEVLDADGQVVGFITSGTVSPVLKQKISMGYVPKKLAKSGTQLKVRVRGKEGDAEVTKMPFVPSNYYSKPKP